jgi:hypothetical protein
MHHGIDHAWNYGLQIASGAGAAVCGTLAQMGMDDANTLGKAVAAGGTSLFALIFVYALREHRATINTLTAEHTRQIDALTKTLKDVVDRVESAHAKSGDDYKEISKQIGMDVKAATEQALSVYNQTANTLTNVAMQCAAQTAAAREKAAQMVVVAPPLPPTPAGRHPY